MNTTYSKNEKPEDDDIPTLSDEEAGLIISCEEVKPNVRKSIRIPLDEGIATCVLNNKVFSVRDLSMYGVGLRIASPDDFCVDDVISLVRIEFSDRSFEVDVRIAHISPHEDGTLTCGMEIVHTYDAGYIDWMTHVINEMKSAMLSIKDIIK